jgi:hypothetical protein
MQAAANKRRMTSATHDNEVQGELERVYDARDAFDS